MSEAQEVLARARAREDARVAATPRIDYDRMKRVWPKQKAALTRARKIEDREQRREKMVLLCRDVVREWDEIGAWPDDWALFQRALDAEFPVFQAPELRDLR